jgi:5,10-methylenetetrahydromethanopterin reductase
MGLGAIPLARTKIYIERVQSLLAGEMVEWDFESQPQKIKFLNPDLGLINLEDEIPLWVSAFGPKAMQLAAELDAGWLNFGISGADKALASMQQAWQDAGRAPDDLKSNLFFLGAVLTGDDAEDDARLMAQGGPLTAVMFHNLADEVGAMGGHNLPTGPLSNLLGDYLTAHDRYEPEDAKYLTNHRGHLMFVRPEETHISPELVRSTTLSGTEHELIDALSALKDAGYSEVTIQLVHDHEAALEDWAKVFAQV